KKWYNFRGQGSRVKSGETTEVYHPVFSISNGADDEGVFVMVGSGFSIEAGISVPSSVFLYWPRGFECPDDGAD
ncbi:MAG: hypothetical protein QGF68_12015, partial [Nitrospinota bacterium]|nr:hypothetical protein [Nitrospinota bacterium]